MKKIHNIQICEHSNKEKLQTESGSSQPDPVDLLIQNHYEETLTVDQIVREALISRSNVIRAACSIIPLSHRSM